MIPEVGSTALFTFTLNFQTLNGVYRIRAETTFRDALSANVNFVDNLYTPAGLQESDFNTDYNNYLNDRIVVLESVRDRNVVYYVPESVFLNVPDPTINEYFPITLVVNLGVFKNTQVIYPLLDQVKDLVQASVGVSDPLYLLTNPENKLYLTDNQYTQVEQARLQNIRTLIPLSVQLDQATKEILFLKAKIASYENLIKQEATG